MQPQNIFFGLDIGTRSVIGIIGKTTLSGLIEILDIEAIEHPKRAMIDGQIEDIAQVSKIAKMVKENLEKRLGYELERVNIAAAGRALKTRFITQSCQLNSNSAIDHATVAALERDAIAAANEQVIESEKESNIQFICVGYTVTKYTLDNYQISTLIGHKGQECTVELIVTFLPAEVVESLTVAMTAIDLEIQSLTLEPIAAMNAVIPQDLRSLNLALVDIGAGTSDIAISNAGSVVAYAMATVAGDEITECLTQHFILDFNTAEYVKHSLSTEQKSVAFHDILGNDYNISVNDIAEIIRPAMHHLCDVICNTIVEINQQAPSAIFLVGGASKIPYLAEFISKKLNIDSKRVAVGGTKPLQKTITSVHDIFSPEYVTPIGIVITAANSISNDSSFVILNGETVNIYKKSGSTVMDLLLSQGYRYSNLLGNSGSKLQFTLNDEKRLVKGGFSTPATITINGEPSSLFKSVENGDEINVSKSITGDDATMLVHEVLTNQVPINLNGTEHLLTPKAFRDGQLISPYENIQQNDQITTSDIFTIADICMHLNIDCEMFSFAINDVAATSTSNVVANDEILYVAKGQSSPKEGPVEQSTTEEDVAEHTPTEEVVAQKNIPTTLPYIMSTTVQPPSSTIIESTPTVTTVPVDRVPVTATVASTPVPPVSIESVTIASSEVAPVVTAPVEVAPVVTAPVEVAPVEAAPIEVAPVVTAPVEVAPVEVAPVESAPVEVAPVVTAPVVTAPVESAPVESAPVEVAPVEVAPPTATTLPFFISTAIQSPPTTHAEVQQTLSTEELIAEEIQYSIPTQPLNNVEPTATAVQTPPTETKKDEVAEPVQKIKMTERKTIATITLNGSNVELPEKTSGEPYMFFELFSLSDIDPQNPKGQLLIKINNENARYTQVIKDGDNVEIGWM